MKRLISALSCAILLSAALTAQSPRRVLYIYEENNDSTGPWRDYFAGESAAAGFIFEEAAVSEIDSKNLDSYDGIIIHGMVMAFTSRSPVRDWLSERARLAGRPVSIFITANRWFLEKYTRQIHDLLVTQQLEPLDAVSAATKNLSETEKKALVRSHLEHFR